MLEKRITDKMPMYLKKLNLECNNLASSSKSLCKLFNKIWYVSRIKYLNLSKNKLGDSFCQDFLEFLINNKELKELYLHFNRI